MPRGKLIVSVIIASKNGEKFLKRCIDSILLESGNYEIIVIDDGSTDQSGSLLRKLYDDNIKVNLVSLKHNVGAARARNIGVSESRGKYLLFLDADTKIKSGWFIEVISFFDRNKLAGAAQVKLLTMGTNKYDYAGDAMGSLGFLIERARGVVDGGQFDQETPIFSGKSAGMIIRRKTFEQLSGFDEDYQIFLEDTDLFWRTWLAGYQVLFAPKITVWHAYQTDEKPFSYYIDNQVFYRGCKNTLTTLIKNLGIERLWYLFPVNVGCWVVLAVFALLKMDLRRSSNIIGGIIWNIINLDDTLKKRRVIQFNRVVSDDQIFKKVGGKQNWQYYLGKGIAYIFNKPF